MSFRLIAVVLVVAWPCLCAGGPAARPPTSGKPAGVLPVEAERIRLPEPVQFDTRKSGIKPASFPLLDSVAATLETHLDISRLEIEAHTDSRGSAAYNKRMSQERAEAIRRYLVGKGIPGARLVAVGYGEERPIDTNMTAAGRANNRRVELLVKARCPAGQVFAGDKCRSRPRSP